MAFSPEWPPEWFQQMGLMAWPLAACSVLALALSLERLSFVLGMKGRGERDYQALAACLTRYRQVPKALRDETVSIMLRELQGVYYRGIAGLRIIGTTSPMLGLLGTILGIIAAFRTISVQSGPVSPSMIADGLWQAMLTTAVGLFIALPSLLLAHLFRHLSERQLNDLCLRLSRLSLSFETGGVSGASVAGAETPGAFEANVAEHSRQTTHLLDLVRGVAGASMVEDSRAFGASVAEKVSEASGASVARKSPGVSGAARAGAPA